MSRLVYSWKVFLPSVTKGDVKFVDIHLDTRRKTCCSIISFEQEYFGSVLCQLYLSFCGLFMSLVSLIISIASGYVSLKRKLIPGNAPSWNIDIQKHKINDLHNYLLLSRILYKVVQCGPTTWGVAGFLFLLFPLFSYSLARYISFTSYRVGFRCILGLVLTRMNVCRKWDLIQAGENEVLSASRNTTHTMSFPMWRFLCSWGRKKM